MATTLPRDPLRSGPTPLFLLGLLTLIPLFVGCMPQPPAPKNGRLFLTGLLKGNILPVPASKDSLFAGRDIGGAQFLSGRLKQLQQQAEKDRRQHLLLDLGDAFSGSSEAYFTRGKAIVEVLNYLAPDGFLIGNVDLAFGVQVLKELASLSQFPFIGTNITYRGGVPFFKEALVVEKGPLKIGVLGQVPLDTPEMTLEDNILGLNFIASESFLVQRAVEMKRAGGVDLVILLSQINFENSANVSPFAGQNAIDLVVCLDYAKRTTAPFAYGSTTIKLVSGFNRGQEIDFVDFEVLGNGAGIYFSDGGRYPLLNDEVPADDGLQDLLGRYVRQIESIKNKPLGSIPNDLKRGYTEESALGNFFTDAMRLTASASVAFLNSGGIVTDLNQGVITEGDLYSALPYENSLVTVDLTGKDIREILELSAMKSAGVLQQSGIFFTFMSQNPPNQKVIEVEVEQQPLREDRVYSVAINDFLFRGGDRFVPFKRGKNMRMWGTLREAVKKFLKTNTQEGQVLHYPGPEGRIKEIGQ